LIFLFINAKIIFTELEDINSVYGITGVILTMEDQNWASRTGADGLTFGERLKDLIVNSGKTAKVIAEETGISASALSDYQKDPYSKKSKKVRIPDSVTFKKLANYFDVTYEYLYGDVSASIHQNLAASEYYGFNDKTAMQLRNMHTTGDSRVDRLLSDALSTFNALFHHGFADLLLELALIREDMERISNDSATAFDKSINLAVGNLHKNRPAGTALVSQSSYAELSLLRIEQTFGDLVRKSMPSTFGEKSDTST